jgi:hypothetical protein
MFTCARSIAPPVCSRSSALSPECGRSEFSFYILLGSKTHLQIGYTRSSIMGLVLVLGLGVEKGGHSE